MARRGVLSVSTPGVLLGRVFRRCIASALRVCWGCWGVSGGRVFYPRTKIWKYIVDGGLVVSVYKNSVSGGGQFSLEARRVASGVGEQLFNHNIPKAE